MILTLWLFNLNVQILFLILYIELAGQEGWGRKVKSSVSLRKRIWIFW